MLPLLPLLSPLPLLPPLPSPRPALPLRLEPLTLRLFELILGPRWLGEEAAALLLLLLLLRLRLAVRTRVGSTTAFVLRSGAGPRGLGNGLPPLPPLALAFGF